MFMCTSYWSLIKSSPCHDFASPQLHTSWFQSTRQGNQLVCCRGGANSWYGDDLIRFSVTETQRFTTPNSFQSSFFNSVKPWYFLNSRTYTTHDSLWSVRNSPECRDRLSGSLCAEAHCSSPTHSDPPHTHTLWPAWLRSVNEPLLPSLGRD